ncbi:MAG: hypothetical protein NVSMB25_11840 [Thermoleophilaceae bacterium]
MRPRWLFLIPAMASVAALGAGCQGGVHVAAGDPVSQHGATLFNQHCSGCHTLSAANTRGSRPEGKVLGTSERTNGPNFNVRRENREEVLYAIRNGGFSGAIMPANIVLSKDAQDVALFVERYAGSKAPLPK